MSIAGLYLENFRSFSAPTMVPFRPITLLYGQNSAGKSSIIKSLLMLQQTLTSNIRGSRRKTGMVFSGDLVDLGSFSTAVSNHDVSRTMRIGITVDGLTEQFPPGNGRFTSTWDIREDNGAYAVSVRAQLGEREVLFHHNPQSAQWILDNSSTTPWLELVESSQNLFNHDSQMANDLRKNIGLLAGFSGDYFPRRLSDQLMAPNIKRGAGQPLKEHHPQQDVHSSLEDPTQPLSTANPLAQAWDEIYRSNWGPLGQDLRRLVHVGPLRREPSRFERYIPTQDREVGRSGEHMLALLYEQGRLVTEVNNVLASMELPYRVNVELLGTRESVGTVMHLVLTNVGSSVEVSPSDVGVGYSQLLPLIAQSVLARNQLVCVEQPELHLHPAMQSRLADMFIDQATGGNRARFLIETHSESLMLRMLRRIREQRVSPNDVQVLYVDQDKSGTSVVTELPISEDGEFMTAWPHGFFDERLEELGF